jgi:DNA segregation ATPase FtsK/SpoIIIE-like protein
MGFDTRYKKAIQHKPVRRTPLFERNDDVEEVIADMEKFIAELRKKPERSPDYVFAWQLKETGGIPVSEKECAMGIRLSASKSFIRVLMDGLTDSCGS